MEFGKIFENDPQLLQKFNFLKNWQFREIADLQNLEKFLKNLKENEIELFGEKLRAILQNLRGQIFDEKAKLILQKIEQNFRAVLPEFSIFKLNENSTADEILSVAQFFADDKNCASFLQNSEIPPENFLAEIFENSKIDPVKLNFFSPFFKRTKTQILTTGKKIGENEKAVKLVVIFENAEKIAQQKFRKILKK